MSSLRNAAWTLFRVVVGAGLATHGWSKIFVLSPEGASKMVAFTAKVGSLGFPRPVVFAWASALTELLAGALVAAGFLTRPAAFLACVNMVVAVYSTRAGGWSQSETGALYLVSFLFLLVEGPGPVSVDALAGGGGKRRSSGLR